MKKPMDFTDLFGFLELRKGGVGCLHILKGMFFFSNPLGSVGLVYLPTCMVDLYGTCR